MGKPRGCKVDNFDFVYKREAVGQFHVTGVIDKMHMTMASTDEVFENQHQQQNPEATNPNMTQQQQQQQQNPKLTLHNPQSPKTLELDPGHPPNSVPDGQIGVDPNDDDVEMIGSNVKSVSDLYHGEERRDFEREGFEKEVVGGVVENFMGIEERKMGEENGRFCFHGKNFVGENEMLSRSCNGFDGVGVGGGDDGVESVEFEEEKVIEEVEDGEEERGEEGEEEEEEEPEEEEEEEEEVEVEQGDFSLAMEGETSNNLLQGIETMQVPYSSLFGSMVQTNSLQVNSSQFVNGHDDNVILHSNKRIAGSDDNQILCSNKRMRTGGLDFDLRGGGSDFDMCMEQSQHWMGKARVMYMEKEQACGELSMHQQFLLNELHKRQAESQQLQTTIQRMQQKRQVEVYRYEHELHLMVNLIKGYREALRGTKKKFAEYRERACCAQLDEPLYKDASGGGGLVLSVTELEKQRLKEEEEEIMNRLLIEKIVKDFEAECMLKLEEHGCAVESLNIRLSDVENQIEPLRELIAKQKVLRTSECDPSE